VLHVILRVRIELFLRRYCRDMGPPVRLSGRVFAVWGRTVPTSTLPSTDLFIHSLLMSGFKGLKDVTRGAARSCLALLAPADRRPPTLPCAAPVCFCFISAWAAPDGRVLA
jgi:hypothetical protein